MIEHVARPPRPHGITEAVLSLGYKPDAFIDAYPDGIVRRRPPALRGRARAARHRRRHPLRSARRRASTDRFLVRQRRRAHRPRRRRARRVPCRPRRRGHDRPAPRSRIRRRFGVVPTDERRPRAGLRREAAARRGADRSDQRRHLRARAVGARPHPGRPQGLDRAGDVPGDGRRRRPLRDGRATRTGSTPALPSSTCRPSSTCSTASAVTRPERSVPPPSCRRRRSSSTR